MNECAACGAEAMTNLSICRDCADLATSDVEGASYVRGMIMCRNHPLPLSDPWAKV
jgi:hypothetical protein